MTQPDTVHRRRSRRAGRRSRIARLRAYLVSQNAWGKAEEEQLSAECQQHVEAAVERYLATGPRAPETMFDHLYAELPSTYIRPARRAEGCIPWLR